MQGGSARWAASSHYLAAADRLLLARTAVTREGRLIQRDKSLIIRRVDDRNVCYLVEDIEW